MSQSPLKGQSKNSVRTAMATILLGLCLNVSPIIGLDSNVSSTQSGAVTNATETPASVATSVWRGTTSIQRSTAPSLSPSLAPSTTPTTARSTIACFRSRQTRVTEIGVRDSSAPSSNVGDGIIVEDFAYKYCDAVEILKLGTDVVEIGRYSFASCDNLRNVTMHDFGVRHIRESAFTGCQILQSVTLPVGLTQIDARAFQNTRYLRSIVIPDTGMEYILFSCRHISNSLSPISLLDICQKRLILSINMYVLTHWDSSQFCVDPPPRDLSGYLCLLTHFAICF